MGVYGFVLEKVNFECIVMEEIVFVLVGVYECIKMIVDELVMFFVENGVFSYFILWLFNVYGLGMLNGLLC